MGLNRGAASGEGAMKTDAFQEALAGLRSTLASAEKSKQDYLNAETANRLLRRLPGAWRGKWRHLHVRGSVVDREEFIMELRATVSYLDVYCAKRPKAEPGASSPPQLEAPIDADFQPVRSKRLKVIE